VPTNREGLIALGRQFPPAGFLGGLLLAVVALALPFLQMRFASENPVRPSSSTARCVSGSGAPRGRSRIAAFLTLTFAIPLYLLKIEMIPRETAWLPSLIFLAFIFPRGPWPAGPIRAPSGASARGTGSSAGRPALDAPDCLLYALIVFFTQYTAWQGIWSLYEQHAFLLPVPFLNM